MIGHVARMKQKYKQCFGGSPKKIIHLEDVDLDRRIKLNYSLKKEGERT
jgi:hypothetical protein